MNHVLILKYNLLSNHNRFQHFFHEHSSLEHAGLLPPLSQPLPTTTQAFCLKATKLYFMNSGFVGMYIVLF